MGSAMRFTEIGQQLRAYRLESGLRAEEIAARLGVSRAALYRYEKGEVIKLDTIKRLAELLKISPLSLLGIGVEYYHRPVGYFERIRQIEETADQILQINGPLCYLVTSESYDAALTAALEDMADQAGPERSHLRASADQVLGILAARKRMYDERRPSIISMMSSSRLVQFLDNGIASNAALSERTRRLCRQVAAAETLNIAGLMEAEPMGLQFGLLTTTEPTGNFEILRARDRATLAVNPFRPDSVPGAPTGVAMITAADEAIAAHQRVAEGLWKEAVKGNAAAAQLRDIVAAHPIN
jgi:transcriptional regulator with XRE-family HTH domain